MAKQKNTLPERLPHLEDFAEFREADQRLTKLRQRQFEIEQRQADGPRARLTNMPDDAERLLRGETLTPLPPTEDPVFVQREYRALTAPSGAIAKAEALLSEARQKCGAIIRAQVMPLFEEAGRQYAAIKSELYEPAETGKRILGLLQGQEIGAGVQPFWDSFIG